MFGALFQSLGLASPHAQGALIAGAFSFLGVVLTGSIGIWTWWRNKTKERRDREELREERKHDLQLALWSEIDAIWTQLFLFGDIDRRLERVRATFDDYRASYRDFTPFVTSASGYFLMEKVAADLVILDPKEIELIVRFYRQMNLIDQMADDMRTPQYAALGMDRKQALLEHFELSKHRAVEMAEKCLHELENALDREVSMRLSHRKAQLRTQQINKTEPAQTPLVQGEASGSRAFVHPTDEQSSSEGTP
ncbi:hypothetical protein [Oricola sp.]|uniref:hypothetical protein n=1 Tax=Oricola sp. TaxID=1979950 RepID=UPI003BA9AEED